MSSTQRYMGEPSALTLIEEPHSKLSKAPLHAEVGHDAVRYCRKLRARDFQLERLANAAHSLQALVQLRE